MKYIIYWCIIELILSAQPIKEKPGKNIHEIIFNHDCGYKAEFTNLDSAMNFYHFLLKNYHDFDSIRIDSILIK